LCHSYCWKMYNVCCLVCQVTGMMTPCWRRLQAAFPRRRTRRPHWARARGATSLSGRSANQSRQVSQPEKARLPAVVGQSASQSRLVLASWDGPTASWGRPVLASWVGPTQAETSQPELGWHSHRNSVIGLHIITSEPWSRENRYGLTFVLNSSFISTNLQRKIVCTSSHCLFRKTTT